MHRNYDNAGPDIPGLEKFFSPDADTVADGAVEDMIAFDRLGPLTRAAMTGMCVQFSALGVLQLIRFGVPPALPGGPKSLTIPGVWTRERHQRNSES